MIGKKNFSFPWLTPVFEIWEPQKNIKLNLQSQMNETKPTKPNLPNQIYQNNHTYQTKPTKPNLPSQMKSNQLQKSWTP